MAGSMEKQTRALLWELLRELPNLSLLNGKGCWNVFPRWKKGRIRYKKTNPPVSQTVCRGSPVNVTKQSIVTRNSINHFTPFKRRDPIRVNAAVSITSWERRD